VPNTFGLRSFSFTSIKRVSRRNIAKIIISRSSVSHRMISKQSNIIHAKGLFRAS